MGLQAEALRLQRNRAAAGEGVVDWRWGAIGMLQDLLAGLTQHILVVRVLPLHQAFDNAEQPLALALLSLLGRKPIRVAARVVHQRGEEHRTACGERAARPPEMQRARVAMADRLLAGRCCIDRLQREGNFDEFAGGHSGDRFSQSNETPDDTLICW